MWGVDLPAWEGATPSHALRLCQETLEILESLMFGAEERQRVVLPLLT